MCVSALHTFGGPLYILSISLVHGPCNFFISITVMQKSKGYTSS